MPEKSTIILGVTGGIAAYKMADLTSQLSKDNLDVQIIMTHNATAFITPLTMETLSGNRCLYDTFDRTFDWNMHHISLAKKAEVMLIAPASANVIAKLAHGIADDLLTTTALAMPLATHGKILVAPAMNSQMYLHPATQQNLKTLAQYGYIIIPPEVGLLACKDEGVGRLASLAVLREAVLDALVQPKDLTNVRVLVSAGPTREAMDPVRFLSNRSTGKMGISLARQAKRRGAEVILVHGPCTEAIPTGVRTIAVSSASEMFDVIQKNAKEIDLFIKAAAVADFTPKTVSQHKIKKTNSQLHTLDLQRTPDILAWLGEHKTPRQVVCGFAMETEHLLENASAKLARKNADMIVANDLTVAGAGFGVDSNVVTILTKDTTTPLLEMKKDEVANEVLSRLLEIYQEKIV